jgi:hypothetical protein
MLVKLAQQDVAAARVDAGERMRAGREECGSMPVRRDHDRVARLPDGHEPGRGIGQRRAQTLFVLAPVGGAFEIRSGQHVGMRARQRHAGILARSQAKA